MGIENEAITRCAVTNAEGTCAGNAAARSGLTACDAQTPAEVCNGLDDDCDGQIDEGLVAPLAELQAGVCVGQVKVCSGAMVGSAGLSATPGLPAHKRGAMNG